MCLYFQILHCISPLLNSISIGYAQGYSAVAISKMEHHFGPQIIDVDAQSWIGSLVSLGLMVGSLIGGFLSDFFSEKVCFLITSPFIIGGWICIFCTNQSTLTPMYIGRFLTGFGTGTHFPLVHYAMSCVSHGDPIWYLILQFETNALLSSEVTYWVQTVLVIKDTIKMNKKYFLVINLSCI